jgi:Zn-dependent protease
LSITLPQVRAAILFLIALVISIAVHEFGHAWMATKLGDSLPRSQGRLTLAPHKHIDPIGTLLFPLLMIFTGAPLLGWGRPVQTDPRNYTDRFSRATGHMMVAVAGPAMNLVLLLLASLLVVLGLRFGFMSAALATWLVGNLVLLNFSLMFFNLLPIPPLDGGAVLAWILPRSMQNIVDFFQRWGFFILFGLMMTGFLDIVMTPARSIAGAWVDFLQRVSTEL